MARLAVLGLGTMGTPIARRLLAAGHEVTVWNRSRERAEALAADGARIASTPADAAAEAEIVVTVVSDASAVESVMTGAEGALARMRRDAVWLQMSTIGVPATERLAARAAERGIAYVDAPVMGSKPDAEGGTLRPLVSGPPAGRDACAPVLDAVSERVISVGERTGAGTALKLVANGWIVCIVENLAESFALAEALGVDPALLLEAIRGRAFDMAYAHMKGALMLEREFPPAFALKLARKDLALIAEAAEGKVELPLARATAAQFDRAIALGHGDEDMAAVYFASADAAEP